MGISLNRESAINDFWNSFGVPAFPSTNVPDQKDRPVAYIVYSDSASDFVSGENYISVNVWYRTTSEKKINNIVRNIEDTIGIGGVVVKHDKGAIWIKRGNPWVQSLPDSDPDIKRRYINIQIEDWRV